MMGRHEAHCTIMGPSHVPGSPEGTGACMWRCLRACHQGSGPGASSWQGLVGPHTLAPASSQGLAAAGLQAAALAAESGAAAAVGWQALRQCLQRRR